MTNHAQGAPKHTITSNWGTFIKSQDVVHPVNSTGVYCMRLIATGLSSLSTQFLNPYGDLPAEFYPLLKLSGILLLGYGLLLLLWCWLSIRNYRHLMPLQNHVGVVLLLSALEMAISYVFYNSVNFTGRTSYLLVLLVALASAARGTAALFFLLLASLGYGVVIASLEADKKRSVYTLTGAHLFFSTTSTVASVSNPQAGALSTLLLTVPLTITYTLFCHWILAGLTSTRENLAIRKQRGKLAMYKQMTRVLYALFALAALFMIIAVLVVLEHKDGAPDGNVAWRAANWRWLWFLSAGWPMVLTFLGAMAIAWIFRPQTYNRTYGVSELNEYPLDEDDLDGRATVALDALRRGKTGEMETDGEHIGRDRWASEPLDAFAQDPSEDESNLRPRESS